MNETHHINDVGLYGLEMEKDFHIGQMDDNKKWHGYMNEVYMNGYMSEVKSTQWNSLFKWNWLHV